MLVWVVLLCWLLYCGWVCNSEVFYGSFIGLTISLI